MLLFYQISAWVFLIHMFLYVGFYCTDTSTHRLIIDLVEYTATEPFGSIKTSFVRELNQRH